MPMIKLNVPPVLYRRLRKSRLRKQASTDNEAARVALVRVLDAEEASAMSEKPNLGTPNT